MPAYAGSLNHAHHVDAGKLAALLKHQADELLRVYHIRDEVVAVNAWESGDINTVRTRGGLVIDGDLFIDCTGNAAWLIGEHYRIPFVDRNAELLNDRALVVQIPVAPDGPIASQTNATAHPAGWTWDIGLPTRRSIGCVYALQLRADDATAEDVKADLRRMTQDIDTERLSFRPIAFRSGHRELVWHRNCLAIALSAGLLEPLKPSTIVLIELSLDALLNGFPVAGPLVDIHACKSNAPFRYRWDRIVKFLQRHDVLSQRAEPYRRTYHADASIPPHLADLPGIWRHRPPIEADFPSIDELFSAESHQYVLYGLGFSRPTEAPFRFGESGVVGKAAAQANLRACTLAASLPTNRFYLNALSAEYRSLASTERVH